MFRSWHQTRKRKNTFQAVMKRLVDRNVHISGVMARGRDPSSRFHREKWTIGTFIFCWKSALVLLILMCGLSVLWAKLSLHFVRVYFLICFGTQPYICNQETSVGSSLASKNNPSRTAFYRYCQVLIQHSLMYLGFEVCVTEWTILITQWNY